MSFKLKSTDIAPAQQTAPALPIQTLSERLLHNGASGNDSAELRKQRLAEFEAAIMQIADKHDMHMRTVLTARQVSLVVRAQAYAEYFDNDLARFAILRFLESQVSIKGRLRNDVNEMLRAVVAMETPGTAAPWWKRILGVNDGSL